VNRCGSISLLITASVVVLAQVPQPQSLTGRWIVTEDFFGTPRYLRLQVEQQGAKLTGDLSGDKLERLRL